jgi:hypothetical protein
VSSEKAGAKPKPRKPKTKGLTISAAAERNYRVQALRGLAVKRGYGPRDLTAVAVNSFKVSPAVAARLVAEAVITAAEASGQAVHPAGWASS